MKTPAPSIFACLASEPVMWKSIRSKDAAPPRWTAEIRTRARWTSVSPTNAATVPIRNTLHAAAKTPTALREMSVWRGSASSAPNRSIPLAMMEIRVPSPPATSSPTSARSRRCQTAANPIRTATTTIPVRATRATRPSTCFFGDPDEGCCDIDEHCDDEVPCNVDRCISGECRHGPDPLFPTCCQPGALGLNYLNCNDQNPCTQDICNPNTFECTHSSPRIRNAARCRPIAMMEIRRH